MSSNNHNNKQLNKREIYLSSEQILWYKELSGIMKRKKEVLSVPLTKLIQIELLAVEFLFTETHKLVSILNHVGYKKSRDVIADIYAYLYRNKIDIQKAYNYLYSDIPLHPIQLTPEEGDTIADWNNLTNEQKLSYL